MSLCDCGTELPAGWESSPPGSSWWLCTPCSNQRRNVMSVDAINIWLAEQSDQHRPWTLHELFLEQSVFDSFYEFRSVYSFGMGGA
jgi:hypothetical protein